MESAKSQQGGGETGYSNTDWEVYMDSRPPYPRSLIDLIYAYRERQGDAKWNRIVDIGSGIGVALTHFAKDFEVIHMSDPSPANIESGRQYLSSWLLRHSVDSKLEVSLCRGEEAYQHIGEKVADVVICATAAHFIDPDDLAKSSAKLLRPGGTLAVFSYWSPLLPDESTRLRHAFMDAIGNVIMKARGEKGGRHDLTLRNVFMNTSAGDGGLDCLPLPDEYFTDKERVSINCLHAQDLYKKRLIERIRRPGEVEGLSRTLPNEKRIIFEEGTDVQAEGWSRKVDKVFLIKFLQSLRAGGAHVSDEDFITACAEFDKIFDEECPSGKVRVLWPCKLILATRKT